MQVLICTPEQAPPCVYSVVLSRYRGGWLFSRHRQRDTWETQGGHIEPGETPLASARRELYEESGAVPASLTPLCGYCVADADGKPNAYGYGMLFLAEIERLDPLPESEMAEVRWFEALPEPLTYPAITPVLFQQAIDYLAREGTQA